MAFKSDRGDIVRTERSAFDPAFQPYQDLIDQLFCCTAGWTADKLKGREECYAKML